MNAAIRLIDLDLKPYTAPASASSVNVSEGSVIYLAASGIAAAHESALLTANLVKFHTDQSAHIEILEDEVNVRWQVGDKRAVVSFDEDGTSGYALYVNGEFVPGSEPDASSYLPEDLLEYLRL